MDDRQETPPNSQHHPPPPTPNLHHPFPRPRRLYNHTTATVILHWYQPDLISPNNSSTIIPNPYKPPRKPATYVAPQPPAELSPPMPLPPVHPTTRLHLPRMFRAHIPTHSRDTSRIRLETIADAAGMGAPPVAGNRFNVRNKVSLPTGSGIEGGVTTSRSMSMALTTSMRCVKRDISSRSSSSSSISATTPTHTATDSPTQASHQR